MMTATLREPTGFSDPSHREFPVDIVGFSYGEHRDAGGYDRTAKCMLAIVATKDGRLIAVPIGWLTLTDLGRTTLKDMNHE